MHGNKVKEKLNAGQVTTIVSGHSITADTIDFLGPLGIDGIWLEGEHGAVTWDKIGDLSRACDLWGMASLMRIQDKDPGRITRTLDRGVNGIVVPHVNNKADAEQIVQAARFAPLGQRGIYGGRRSYGQPDFFQKANDEILIVALIEEIQAVEKLDEILAVDHIDVFFVAPGDLAQTMDLLGQMNHPEVQAVVEKALRQIVEAGRTAGALGLEENLGQYLNLGVKLILTNFDAWIKAGAQQYLTKIKTLS